MGLLVKVLEKNTVCLFLTTKYARKTFNFVNIHWIGWYTKWGRSFIGVVKYDGVINGGTVTPHASFNFVVAPGRSLITVMLEEVPGVNVRTVYQSDAKPGSGKALSGSGNWPKNSRAGFGKTQNIRDLTATREARFTKILARDAILGKKTIFGMEMTEVRDVGIPRYCRRKERECGMRTLFPDPEKHGCQKCKGRIRGTQRLLSVKYLFERKQILPRIFYYLRTSKKFPDDCSIHVQFSKLM